MERINLQGKNKSHVVYLLDAKRVLEVETMSLLSHLFGRKPRLISIDRGRRLFVGLLTSFITLSYITLNHLVNTTRIHVLCLPATACSQEVTFGGAIDLYSSRRFLEVEWFSLVQKRQLHVVSVPRANCLLEKAWMNVHWETMTNAHLPARCITVAEGRMRTRESGKQGFRSAFLDF